MIQANKLPLFIIVLALSNLALLVPVKAVDPTDTFYGTGAGNGTTTGAACADGVVSAAGAGD